MPLEIYPSLAKVKRNGVYQNLPGFIPETGDDAAQAMIAVDEATTTAQFTHPKGSYFRLNEVLYQADSYIAVNDAISVGNNCHVAVLGSGVYDELHYDDISFTDFQIEEGIDNRNWEQGTINYNTGNIANATNRLRAKTPYNVIAQHFAKIYAKNDYTFSVLVYNSNNTFLGTVDSNGEIAPGVKLKWFTEFVPISTEHYYKFVVRKGNGSEAINMVDGYNNIVLVNTANTKELRFERYFLESEEVPVQEELIGKLYNFNNKTIIDASDAAFRLYRIDDDCIYYVTSEILAANTFAFVQWFDEGRAYISASFSSSKNARSVVDGIINGNMPSNAKYFGINFRSADPFKAYSVKRVSLRKPKKELSILFVGNSLIQDGVAYLPYILKNYYPEIKFKFYMFYNGGYTLAQQYTDFQNDVACDIFSIADNSASWSNYSNKTKMSGILNGFRFDIVCMQEYFNYKESYSVSDLTDWNNCRDYITANYHGDNPLEFISFFHAPLRAEADDVFALTKEGNALILNDTIADDMIPAGIAIYRAMSTSLDSLGDQSHLSNDGTHAQEGLPCLLETYTILCWLFDKLGMNKSVYGDKFRITTEIYNSIHVPGPNLGSGLVTGTDAQYLLAQEVAIQAYKEGKSFVNKNIYVEPSP